MRTDQASSSVTLTSISARTFAVAACTFVVAAYTFAVASCTFAFATCTFVVAAMFRGNGCYCCRHAVDTERDTERSDWTNVSLLTRGGLRASAAFSEDPSCE